MATIRDDRTIRRRALLAGLAVWAVATLAFRLIGQRLLLPGWGGAAAFALVGAAMALLGPALRRAIGASRLRADRAAVAMTAPGLLLDAGVTAFFDRLLPNIDPAWDGQFGRSCSGATGSPPWRSRSTPPTRWRQAMRGDARRRIATMPAAEAQAAPVGEAPRPVAWVARRGPGRRTPWRPTGRPPVRVGAQAPRGPRTSSLQTRSSRRGWRRARRPLRGCRPPPERPLATQRSPLARPDADGAAGRVPRGTSRVRRASEHELAP